MKSKITRLCRIFVLLSLSFVALSGICTWDSPKTPELVNLVLALYTLGFFWWVLGGGE